ncbi:hypothetical protein EHS25_009887 [Saitozyma podzolica]|uniref:Uncharacterized protein n=1 Tax=Saitozyma podzolica TaxID=1890683 RepID=A0A427YI00_9TREE|nr:hypothetical protein EHS25_009887 [Saitozyma podzolica]
MGRSIALVTGATSGLGHATARLLAAESYRQVIVTGRSLARIKETPAELATETQTQIFTPLELELDEPSSVQSALAELVRLGRPIDFLLLNAGMVPGKARVLTAAGIEASQAPLIGHHQLAVGLLRANLLSPTRGSSSRARNLPEVPNNAYADAKLIIAWWVGALARRLPSGMAVYAVSPGAATDTKAVRNAGPALKYLFIPIVNLIPGMNQTPETAARRYLQASQFGADVSGQFFASAQGKFTGPIEAQRHPHLHDRASQEAAWQAVVKVSGIDLLAQQP